MFRGNSVLTAWIVLLVLLNAYFIETKKKTTTKPSTDEDTFAESTPGQIQPNANELTASEEKEEKEREASRPNSTTPRYSYASMKKNTADFFYRLGGFFMFPGSRPNTTSAPNGTARNVQYQLFTLNNKMDGEILTLETELSDSEWNPDNKAIFIIHGYIQTFSADLVVTNPEVFERLKDAYMDTKRIENIVLVDQSKKGRRYIPSEVEKDVQAVGEDLAEMLISLKKRKFLTSYSQIHLIGFSLGAHVAAVAANQIWEKINVTIPHITGLDPASPGFDESVDAKLRLDKGDAKFVDVMHCNTGKVFRGKGTKAASGHVDFFPNGGEVQPGCTEIDFKQKGVCSHIMCVPLYAKTVRGVKYPGCECEGVEKWNKGECTDCEGPPMGDLCPKYARGKYFLNASLDDGE